MSSQPSRTRGVTNPLIWLGPPVAITGVLWFSSANIITLIQAGLALLLAGLPWAAYLRWKGSGTSSFPVYALVSGMYWIFYAVPLFWGGRIAPSMWALDRSVSQESVTQAMGLVCAGVLAMGFGVLIAPTRLRRRGSVQASHAVVGYRWGYVRWLLLIGSVLGLFDQAPVILGEGLRQVLSICATAMPTVAFAVLYSRMLRGEASRGDRWAIAFFLVSRVLGGLSSGWLGTIPLLGLTAAVVYVRERRAIPTRLVLAGAAVLAVVLFLQPGKQATRAVYWQAGSIQASPIDRAMFWVNESGHIWEGVLSGGSQTTWRDLVYQTLERAALLTQTANVIDTTPSLVPYQGGSLYSYLLATWTPRIVWPDKPTVNEANQLYQVTYGLTTPQNLGQVSIAVGSLTEGYIAFGWTGTLLVMLLIGALVSVVQTVTFGRNAGPILVGVGAVLAVQLAQIEGQLAQYIGGLPQLLGMLTLLFLPAVRFKRVPPIRPDLHLSGIAKGPPQYVWIGAGHEPLPVGPRS